MFLPKCQVSGVCVCPYSINQRVHQKKNWQINCIFYLLLLYKIIHSEKILFWVYFNNLDKLMDKLDKLTAWLISSNCDGGWQVTTFQLAPLQTGLKVTWQSTWFHYKFNCWLMCYQLSTTIVLRWCRKDSLMTLFYCFYVNDIGK